MDGPEDEDGSFWGPAQPGKCELLVSGSVSAGWWQLMYRSTELYNYMLVQFSWIETSYKTMWWANVCCLLTPNHVRFQGRNMFFSRRNLHTWKKHFITSIHMDTEHFALWTRCFHSNIVIVGTVSLQALQLEYPNFDVSLQLVHMDTVCTPILMYSNLWSGICEFCLGLFQLHANNKNLTTEGFLLQHVFCKQHVKWEVHSLKL